MINDEFGQRLRMAFNAPRELPVHQLFNEWWSHVPTDVANSYVAIPLVDRRNVSGAAKALKGPQIVPFDVETWNIAEWTR